MKRHVFMLGVTALILLGTASSVRAQAPDAGLAGTWQGVLVVPTLAGTQTSLRLVMTISRSSDNVYSGSLQSLDQGGVFPIDRIEVNAGTVRLEMKAAAATFDGSLSSSRSVLKGTLTQVGNAMPLELTRLAGSDSSPKANLSTSPSPAFGLPLEMQVPAAPRPFTAGKRVNLVYEVHLTNLGASDLPVSRLEVLAGSTVVGSFEGAQLSDLLMRPGAPNLSDKRTIGPGMRAVAYLWIPLNNGAPVPDVLHHRVSIGALSVDGAVIRVGEAKATVIGPPVRGEWMPLQGAGNDAGLRRALFAFQGAPRIAQRFAIDWVQAGTDGKTFAGNEKDSKSYRAYGRDVLAVGDAVVVSVQDGIPENVPGSNSRAVAITPETIGGNYVILDLGGNHFAFYGHLQPGSLRVRVGNRVQRGQVIGLVGNSGDCDQPQLHFHMSDTNSVLDSEGLPYAMESFDVLGTSGWETRRNEMPLQNIPVRFP